jgi:hypothetical protein
MERADGDRHEVEDAEKGVVPMWVGEGGHIVVGLRGDVAERTGPILERKGGEVVAAAGSL